MKLQDESSTLVIRPPACAGRFYSADPSDLQAEINAYLAGVELHCTRWPKAVIAPHAGYVYSGPIAASAYAHLALGRDVIRRVVLIGPSHYETFWGVATSAADAFATPLGEVRLDRRAIRQVEELPQVRCLESAHRFEHSLEVQLPFLQTVLSEFQVVPLLVGESSDDEVGEVLAALWGDEETCVVVSSDLSHHQPYAAAQRLDLATSRWLEGLRGQELHSHHACGWQPIRGMLYVARDKGLRCRNIDLRNSGDTAGQRDRVVGYGAYLLGSE